MAEYDDEGNLLTEEDLLDQGEGTPIPVPEGPAAIYTGTVDWGTGQGLAPIGPKPSGQSFFDRMSVEEALSGPKPPGQSFFDRMSVEEALSGPRAPGQSFFDQMSPEDIFAPSQALVVSNVPRVIPPGEDVGQSALTRAYESPVGQGIAAGVLQSAPGLAVRGVERVAGLPVAAPPQVEGFLPQLAQQLTTLGIDIPVLWAPAGRVARLGIERAVAWAAERMGPQAAADYIFSRIGEAAKTAATSGLTFSAADASKAALEAAQEEPVVREKGLGDLVTGGPGTARPETWSETAGRIAGRTATAAAKGFPVGLGVGLASEIAQPVVKVLAELGAMTAIPAVEEGRLPTMQELLQGGVTLGALKLGYRILGLDFPAVRRMSEAEVTAAEDQYLRSLDTDRLQWARDNASPQSPRYEDFLKRVDAILRERGAGGAAPVEPAALLPPAPPGARAGRAPTPEPQAPIAPVPPPEPIPPAPVAAAAEPVPPPEAGAPAVEAPPGVPTAPSTGISPETEPHIFTDGQQWWAIANGQQAGPFEDNEEAYTALTGMLQGAQAPPGAAPPAAPLPSPAPAAPGAPEKPIWEMTKAEFDAFVAGGGTVPQAEAPPPSPRVPRGRPPSEPLPAMTPDLEMALSHMLADINQGEPGRRRFDTGDFTGVQRSTYPDWMGKNFGDKATAVAAIQAALQGRPGLNARLAMRIAEGYVETLQKQYPAPPPAVEAPPPETAPGPVPTEVGERVTTPQGAGEVVEKGPFGDVNVHLDDDGVQVFMEEELGLPVHAGLQASARPDESYLVDLFNQARRGDPIGKSGQPDVNAILSIALYQHGLIQRPEDLRPHLDAIRQIQEGPGSETEKVQQINAYIAAAAEPPPEAPAPTTGAVPTPELSEADSQIWNDLYDVLHKTRRQWLSAERRGDSRLATNYENQWRRAFERTSEKFGADQAAELKRLTDALAAEELGLQAPEEPTGAPVVPPEAPPEAPSPEPAPEPPPAPPAAPRFEQTAAGPQAIVPGTDIPQVTSGRIRRPETGPALTSADAEANLFNQEATARREELAASQGQLPMGAPEAPAPVAEPAWPFEIGTKLTYTGPAGFEGFSPGAQYNVLWVNEDGSVKLLDPRSKPITLPAQYLELFRREPPPPDAEVADPQRAARLRQQLSKLSDHDLSTFTSRRRGADDFTRAIVAKVIQERAQAVKVPAESEKALKGELEKIVSVLRRGRGRYTGGDTQYARQYMAAALGRGPMPPEQAGGAEIRKMVDEAIARVGAAGAPAVAAAPAPPSPPAPAAAPAAPKYTGTGKAGSRYEGEKLADLLPTVEDEQSKRFYTMRRLKEAIADPGRRGGERRLEKLKKELETLTLTYEGTYSEVADAAGEDVAAAMQRAVEIDYDRAHAEGLHDALETARGALGRAQLHRMGEASRAVGAAESAFKDAIAAIGKKWGRKTAAEIERALTATDSAAQLVEPAPPPAAEKPAPRAAAPRGRPSAETIKKALVADETDPQKWVDRLARLLGGRPFKGAAPPRGAVIEVERHIGRLTSSPALKQNVLATSQETKAEIVRLVREAAKYSNQILAGGTVSAPLRQLVSELEGQVQAKTPEQREARGRPPSLAFFGKLRQSESAAGGEGFTRTGTFDDVPKPPFSDEIMRGYSYVGQPALVVGRDPEGNLYIERTAGSALNVSTVPRSEWARLQAYYTVGHPVDVKHGGVPVGERRRVEFEGPATLAKTPFWQDGFQHVEVTTPDGRTLNVAVGQLTDRPLPSNAPAEAQPPAPAAPPPPPKPLWEMTKAEYDDWIAQGGVPPTDIGAEMKVVTPEGTFAKPTVDPRLNATLRRNMYKGDIGLVTIKELFQNSLDALRALPDVGEGKLTAGINQRNRTIVVKDTGVGMTPELAHTVLVEPGGSFKPTGASGGFGLAKVAIFGNAETVKVVTTARREDGSHVTTTLEGTSEDWLDESRAGFRTTEEEHSSRPIGTEVRLKMLPDARFSQWDYVDWLQDFFRYSRLPFQVSVHEDTQTYPALGEGPAVRPIKTLDVPGATVDVLVGEETQRKGEVRLRVLNNGIYQFSSRVYLGEGGAGVDLPKEVVVDIHAKEGVTEADYPFTPNRQQLQDTVEEALGNYVRDDLLRDALHREVGRYKAVLAAAPAIPGTTYKVYDTAQKLPADIVQSIAKDRVVRDLMVLLDGAANQFVSAILTARGATEEEELGHFTIGGIGLGGGYQGINIRLAEVVGDPKHPNLILFNPYTAIESTRALVGAGLQEFPDELGGQIAATILHELVHQKARPHEDPKYSEWLTNYAGMTADVIDHVARDVSVFMREEREKGKTNLEHLAETLRLDLRPRWSEGRDFFASVSVLHARERGRAGGPSGPGAGEEGGGQPGRLVRGRPEGPAEPLPAGPVVPGGGAPVAESPHKAAIRRALELGQLTPERAKALGHFDSYPDLQAAKPVRPYAPAPQSTQADTISRLVQGFTDKLTAGGPPVDAALVPRLAAEILGEDPGAYAQTPGKVRDAFDAFEGAISRVLQQDLANATSLDEQIQMAWDAEMTLADRPRSLDTLKREQFDPPLPLAVAAIHALDLKPGEVVAIPQAGTGGLMAAVPGSNPVVANEIDPRRAEVLRALGRNPKVSDALYTPLHGSVQVMAPPWGKFSVEKYGPGVAMPHGMPFDIAEHFVVKGLRDLPQDGRLVAILPASVMKNESFTGWLTEQHTLRAVIGSPPGAYTSRGTRVDSVLLVVDKGRIPDAPEPRRSTPQTWNAYVDAIRELAGEGPHSRPGGPVAPVTLTGAAQALDTARPGGAWTPSPATGQVEAPSPPGSGEPDDGEVVRPGGLPVSGAGPVAEGRPPRGGARHAPADVVAGGGQPEVPGAGLRADTPSGLAPDLGKERPTPTLRPLGYRVADQRFSYAHEHEYRASLDSRVFTPAPLRSANGHNPHPRLVVQTRSLAGARRPALEYQPSSEFIREAYLEKRISDAQWDYGIVPALQANARGHGYLAAADVGVGKTRMAAAVMGEWLETGHAKRILYVTKNDQNIGDVRTEMNATAPGNKWPFRVIDVRDSKDASDRRKAPAGEPRPKIPAVNQAVYVIDKANLASYSSALVELGVDAIVGDEAHEFKNAKTEVGAAWLAIQEDVLARGGKFLYLTATPATDFDDLRHFVGLKEWTFASFPEYKAQIAGVKAQAESIDTMRKRVFKAWTDYATRSGIDLRSFKLVYDQDPAYVAWNKIQSRRDYASNEYRDALVTFDAIVTDALAKLPPDPNAPPPKAQPTRGGRQDAFHTFLTPAETEQVMRELSAKGKYDAVDLWRAGTTFTAVSTPVSTEQDAEFTKVTEFFKKLLAAHETYGGASNHGIWSMLQGEAKGRIADYRLDQAVEIGKRALERGEQPIFSVLRVSQADPREGFIGGAIRMLRTTRTDPVTGDEIEIPEAKALQDALYAEWATFRQTRNPVDVVTKTFGAKHVTAITGQTKKRDRPVLSREFQEGKRTVAIISTAGKTGINLHHVVETELGPGHGKRRVIIVDYEWSATEFKQGPLGRADRSGQLTSPDLDMLTNGSAGERKFIATIANRMRNLGANSAGSAEAATNDKLAEFEIGGSLDTAAMRGSWAALPRETRAAFLHPHFVQGGRPVHQLGNAAIKTWLMDLAMMPIKHADIAFEAFWKERQALIDRQQELREEMGLAQRTRTHRGEILRTSELREDLVLHTLRDSQGHKFGLLQGLITPYMKRIAPFLPTTRGVVHRRYLTFSAGDEQVSGLEVGITRMAGLAQTFGASLHGDLVTPDQVQVALDAGDHIKVWGPAGQTYTLHLRKDDLIQIDRVRVKEQPLVQEHGAHHVALGDFWALTKAALPQFVEVFTAMEPPRNPGQGETPDQATQANLGEEGGVLIDLLAAPLLAAKLAIGSFARFPSAAGRSARSGRPTATEAHRAEDPVVEAALSSTRGPMGSWLETINETMDTLKKSFVWEATIPDYPLEKDEIRLFQTTRRHVQAAAKKDVVGMLRHLAVKGDVTQTRENFDLWARILLLRDYVSRASQPLRFPGGLPYGVTSNKAEAELQRLEAKARGNQPVSRALDAYARLMEAELQDLRARGKLTEDRAIANYFPHLVLEYEARYPGEAPRVRRMGEPARPFTYLAKGSAKPIETDVVRALYKHRHQVRYANASDDFVLKLLARHDIMAEQPKHIRALAPGSVVPIKGIDHSVFQYKPGRAVFLAQTAPERVIAAAIAAGLDQIAIDELRQRPSLGAYHRRYLIPTQLAQRLEAWDVRDQKSMFDILQAATNKWKGVTIGFWGTAGHLVNGLGDLVNIARADPWSWRYLYPATKEIVRWGRGQSSELIDLLDKYDVLEAGYVGKEISLSSFNLDVGHYPELRDFMSRRDRNLADVKRWTWDLVAHRIGRGREAIPRTALAMSLLKRIEQGQSLKKQARGIDIRGLPPIAAAMKIAREAPVDYGRFSHFVNKYVRGLFLPFYAWTAANAANWIRWAMAAPLSAALIVGFRMLLEYWNNSTEDKHRAERALPEYQRVTPHVNLGFYNSKGEMLIWYFPGDPITDVLSLVGLDKSYGRVADAMWDDITLGKATKDQLTDTFVQPFNRLAQMLTPMKMILEVPFNKSAFGWRDITPKPLVGTYVDVGRRARYATEGSLRFLREARTAMEKQGSLEGIDWLTFRFGLGLPIVTADPRTGEAKRQTQIYYDALTEAINTGLHKVEADPRFQRLPPLEKEQKLRDAATEIRRRLESQTHPPVSAKFWRDLAVGQ